MVKNKIAWPQDTVLGGQSHQRVTYDQLSLTQWVQGFAKNIIEENCQDTREHMLYYLADIMSDTTDFSWFVIWRRGLFLGSKHQKLTGLGGLMPKNNHKILNLGPKIRIPAQVKSHGFAKHFKLVYVGLIGIMRAMGNGSDIFVKLV